MARILNRRAFLSAAASAMAGSAHGQNAPAIPADIVKLRPMVDGIKPITDAERDLRVQKARRLMREQNLAALFVEAGSTLFYFTGTRGVNGANLFGCVLPLEGEPVWLIPEDSVQRLRGDIRTHKSNEAALASIALALKDRGAAAARIGFEENVRFAIFEAVRTRLPASQIVSATPVTAGCRMFKSPAEIALMQRASDITIAAYRAALAHLAEGMTTQDLTAYVVSAYRALGATGNVNVIFGEYTAFPHGSITPQRLKEGDFVLLDDGCAVDGYQSDVTRTVIFGKPTARQRQVWELEKRAQAAAFRAAQPGRTCESVDAAARKVITDAGFGPGYKLPGLPHRTGHGIGLDIHEWTNLVRGNKTPLQPGMCFSDEPTISIYGEFGVRLEDCFYIAEDGPRMFLKPSPAIDQPFG